MKLKFIEKLKKKILRWLARRLPDCQDITPKIGQTLDGKLPRRQRLITAFHLFTCQACALYAEQIEFIREVLKEQEKHFQAADFPPELEGEPRERT